MVKPHNLKTPILQSVDTKDVNFVVEDEASLYQCIGELTACWASFEFSLTGLLIYHSGMPARNGYLMIGRMSSRSKLEKIISILKANRNQKDDHDKRVDFFKLLKSSAVIPCDIRNILSHCTYWGCNKEDDDILYFGGTRLREKSGEDRVYVLRKEEIKKASEFALNTAHELKTLNLRLLLARTSKAS